MQPARSPRSASPNHPCVPLKCDDCQQTIPEEGSFRWPSSVAGIFALERGNARCEASQHSGTAKTVDEALACSKATEDVAKRTQNAGGCDCIGTCNVQAREAAPATRVSGGNTDRRSPYD